MNRTSISFKLDNINAFKESLLNWSEQFNYITWLDSNYHNEKFHSYEAILAVDAAQFIYLTDTENAFQQLSIFQKRINDYSFGFLSYDLKNDIEQLTSNNPDELNFPSLFFFQPKKIVFIKDSHVTFSYLDEFKHEINNDYFNITEFINNLKITDKKSELEIHQRVSKNNYLKKFTNILEHIHRGDIYEINYCMDFYIKNHDFYPLKAFQHLNNISSPPFAAYFKLNSMYLCSASPERYLKKEGTTVLSQPIKGTAKRGSTATLDSKIKLSLENNPKERAENIMIVDLVRNDLSKNAIKGSVKVDELCKVYTFKQVHQLISTVVAEVNQAIDPISLIKNTFPMGSMTGAPKISAMKIIEEVEENKRGLYSGAVGYFTPEGNFDFNVVIRSILHNASNKYTSFSVGSAITALSNPEHEYEECLLKAKAMIQVLSDM